MFHEGTFPFAKNATHEDELIEDEPNNFMFMPMVVQDHGPPILGSCKHEQATSVG